MTDPKSNYVDEHECRAAVLNAVLVRCRQNGRGFFTAEDARVSDLFTRALLQLDEVGAGVREGAQQTMPSHAAVAAFAAVEGALRPKSVAEENDNKKGTA
jgi:hypothetical protein